MLLDTSHRIVPQVTRLWRGTALAVVFALTCGLSLVTLRATPTVAEDTGAQLTAEAAPNDQPSTQRLPALDSIATSEREEGLPQATKSAESAAQGSDDQKAGRPDSLAASSSTLSPVPIENIFHEVQFDCVIVEVDHGKLEHEKKSLESLIGSVHGKGQLAIDAFGSGLVIRTSSDAASTLIAKLKEVGSANVLSRPSLRSLVRTETVAGPRGIWPDRTVHMDISSGPTNPQILLKLTPTIVPTADAKPVHMRLDLEVLQRRVDAKSGAKNDPQVPVPNPVPRPVRGAPIPAQDSFDPFTASVSSGYVLAASMEVGDKESLVTACEMRDASGDPRPAARLLVVISPSIVRPAAAEAEDPLKIPIGLRMARAEVARARERHAFVQRLAKKGYTSQHEIDAARAELDQAEALERAQTNLGVALQSSDNAVLVDKLRTQISALTEEIRSLRVTAVQAESGQRTNGAADEPNDRSVEVQMLELDVTEAEVDVEAARAAVDVTQQTAEAGLSTGDVTAKKLALRKAEIALKRARLRLDAARRPALNPDASAPASEQPKTGSDGASTPADESARSLTITIRATKDGQVASLSFQGVRLFGGPMLSRQLRNQLAGRENYEEILLRAHKNLKYEELMKIVEVCSQQKTRAGKPIKKLRFVELPDDATNPVDPRAPNERGGTERRRISVRAQVIALRQAGLEKLLGSFQNQTGPKEFLAALSPGKTARTQTAILDAAQLVQFLAAVEGAPQSQILADSRIVNSGTTAQLEWTPEWPVPSAATPVDPIAFRGSVITLTALPTLQDDDLIRLQLMPELRILGASSGTSGSAARTARRVQTTVELRAGQAIVLAGLFPRDDQGTVSKVPVLGDLPAAGSLFQKQNVDDETELLILVTADLVPPEKAATTTDLRTPRQQRQPSNALAPTRLPPDEENRVLTEWQAATQTIRRIDLEFSRLVYDAESRVETRSEGVIAVESPLRAMYVLAPTGIQGHESKKLGNDGTRYALQTEPHERGWIWAGRDVLTVDLKSRTYGTNSRPLDGASIRPGFEFLLARPFLMGMTVAELREQFDVAVISQSETEFRLSFVPRQPERLRAFSKAVLILGRKDWLPRALQLTDDSGLVESVHTFRSVKINGPPIAGECFDKADMGRQGFTESAGVASTAAGGRTDAIRAVLPRHIEQTSPLTKRLIGIGLAPLPEQPPPRGFKRNPR